MLLDGIIPLWGGGTTVDAASSGMGGNEGGSGAGGFLNKSLFGSSTTSDSSSSTANAVGSNAVKDYSKEYLEVLAAAGSGDWSWVPRQSRMEWAALEPRTSGAPLSLQSTETWSMSLMVVHSWQVRTTPWQISAALLRAL